MRIDTVRVVALGCVVASLVGCFDARRLKRLDEGLKPCVSQARSSTGADNACQTSVAKIAQESLAAARETRGDPAMTVSFYRVAAVASVEAGPLGSSTLPQAADEGAAACDRLPQKDASAPRDCSLIRLALPLGVGRELAAQTQEFIAKRDRNGSGAGTAGRGTLPASDSRAVRNLFDGFEVQTQKVCDVASTMPRPLLPPKFVQNVAGIQRSFYCWTSKTYSLVFDVDGESDVTTTTLAQRKQALRQLVEGQVGPIDCRTVPSDVPVPQ